MAEKASTGLELRAPRAADHDEMIDLIAKTFSHGGYFWFRDYCTRGYVDHSHYDWEASRIGLRDGKIVTHFGVWNYLMRIGEARVKTGGIGIVATHADHRKQGLMDLTAKASLDAMRALGYDFSILFGISNFYDRFGYTRAWSDTFYYVPLSDMPEKGPETEDLKAVPREDLARLYNRHHAAATGTAVRPTYRAVFYPGKDWMGLAWRERKKGPIAGYVFFTHMHGRIECMEVVGDATTAMAVLADEARRQHCSEVRFETLPATSELARRLKRGTCRVETAYNRCGGAMIVTVNLVGALTKMVGELESRLAASAMAEWKGELTLSDPRMTATLSIARGKISVKEGGKSKHAIVCRDELAQILIGTESVGEILEAYDGEAHGDAAAVAEALFPKQWPNLHMGDRY